MTREQFGKLIADIYAMRSMDRDNGGNESELTLDATLAETQVASPDDLELTAELAESKPITRKAWRKYAGKLRMLARIKTECLPAINAARKAKHEIGAGEGKGQFIPEEPCDYVALWIDNARQPMPSE